MKKKSRTPATIPLSHPRAHNQFIGHEAQEALILQSFHSGKMPHAWLIAGPKGIGKATLAYRIAKFLCTHNQSNNTAANHIAQGSSPDLLVLEAEDAANITVEEVRSIGHFLHLTASQSPYRIVIIDSADALNINAANALLKLLEEPPANCFLFLISHMPGSLLPTIRSRCRMLTLQMLPDADARKVVAAHAGSIAPDDMAALLLLAEGIPGRAISFHHNGLLGYYKELLAILSQLATPDIQATTKLAELHASKSTPAAWANFTYLLNRILAATVKKAAGVTPHHLLPEEATLVNWLALQSTLDTWIKLWENCNHSMEEATRANLDFKQVTLVILDSLHQSLTGKQQA